MMFLLGFLPIITIPLFAFLGFWSATRWAKHRGKMKTIDPKIIIRNLVDQVDNPVK